jgi:hypothetical protein
MSVLTHGDADELHAAAVQRGRGWPDDATWRDACAYLARRVLEAADRCGPLPSLQRTALVPLELRLASWDAFARWQPAGWVAMVEATLQAHAR